MEKDNKIVVAARLLEGNEEKVSVSVNAHKCFTVEDKQKLLKGIKKKFEPIAEDVIYYTYRYFFDNKHDNYKFKTLSELVTKVEELEL